MTRRETIGASGMTCDGCERAVENALRNLEGVRKADADTDTGSVDVVTDGVSDADLFVGEAHRRVLDAFGPFVRFRMLSAQDEQLIPPTSYCARWVPIGSVPTAATS